MSCPSLASRKELKRHQKHEATGQLPPQAWGVWEIGSLQACRASCTLLNFECGRGNPMCLTSSHPPSEWKLNYLTIYPDSSALMAHVQSFSCNGPGTTQRDRTHHTSRPPMSRLPF